MADDEVNPLGTSTANYGWTKPAVGADVDAWGDMLNTDLDGIDSVVKGIEVRGMTPGPPGAQGPAGPTGPAGAPGPAAVSTDVGNSAQLGSDSLVYVPTPTIPPGTVVSATAPASPQVGQLWWDSVGGQLYVWFSDANSSQWVIAVNSAASLLPASTTVLGGVKVDGTTIKAAVDGTISTTVVPMGDNRIVNGDMRIDQRNGGAGGTAIGVYTIDRWQYLATQATKGTWGRYTSGAGGGITGFPYLLGFTSSSAYTSAASDYFAYMQTIEADMVSDFAWGTAQAQSVTLSFWVLSTLTGTFGGVLKNNPAPATRSYPFTFSVLTANLWTKIALTIPGDTAGTWVLSGNAAAISLAFDLGCGSTFRGPANAWASANYLGVTGAVSIVGTNGAGFSVTGVKLEIGSVATPFNRQSLAKSMADCQRYYQAMPSAFVGGNGAAGTQLFDSNNFPVQMRAAPTTVLSGQSYSNASGLNVWAATVTSLIVNATITAVGSGYGIAAAAISAEL